MMPLFRRTALVVAALAPLLLAPPSQACGPACSEPPPKDDVSACLAGKLGDLLRHDARCQAMGFLVLRGLSEPDRQAIAQALPFETPYFFVNPTTWDEVRQKVPVALPQGGITTEATVGDIYFSNCLTGAFEVAAKTLEERIARFGLDSPEVAGWVKAQDAVFQNCGGGERVLPGPPPMDAPKLIRADRAYQTAAAFFYAGDYDEAVSHLDAIGKDAASPWRGWARLVAVRALIRKSTLKASSEEEKRALLEQARERCVAIVKDPGVKDLHLPTRQLTWFIDYRLRPEKQLNLLGRVLLEKPDGNFGYAWGDYFKLRREQGLSEDELSLFLDTLDPAKTKPREAYARALAQWKKARALPWLVAALARAHPEDPELAELLKASRAVPASSPATVSLQAARGRLALQAGHWDEARKELLPLLEAGADTLPPLTVEPLAADLRQAALTFEEWAKFAHLTPMTAGNLFSSGVPVARFKDPKLLAALEAKLRKDVVLTGWTRAVMLEKWDEEKALEPLVEQVAPELAADLARVKARTKPEERKLAAVLVLLKSPGMSIYLSPGRAQSAQSYSICEGNGWCAERELTDFYADCDAAKGPCGTRFISVAERAEVLREREALAELGKAPEQLIRFTLEYAKQNPGDALIPEALHESVRQTRFARNYCGEDSERESQERSALSKQAFQLLQRKYAKTEWAKKTPYHF